MRNWEAGDALGIWGSLLLGIVFAMAFCPTSAALFLKLVQDSTVLRSPVAMPFLFGLGTALPVVAFALILAFAPSRSARRSIA